MRPFAFSKNPKLRVFGCPEIDKIFCLRTAPMMPPEPTRAILRASNRLDIPNHIENNRLLKRK